VGPAATLPTQHLIVIPDNVEDAYVLETLSHGEDHVLLHHDRAGSDCRGTREVEGEFVDMVTAAHGLDSSQWTFKLRGRVGHPRLQKTTTLLLLDRLGVPEARRSPVRKA